MVLKCDKCGAEKDVKSYSFECHQEPLYGEGSFSHNSQWWGRLELCGACRIKLFNKLAPLLEMEPFDDKELAETNNETQ